MSKTVTDAAECDRQITGAAIVTRSIAFDLAFLYLPLSLSPPRHSIAHNSVAHTRDVAQRDSGRTVRMTAVHQSRVTPVSRVTSWMITGRVADGTGRALQHQSRTNGARARQLPLIRADNRRNDTLDRDSDVTLCFAYHCRELRSALQHDGEASAASRRVSKTASVGARRRRTEAAPA